MHRSHLAKPSHSSMVQAVAPTRELMHRYFPSPLVGLLMKRGTRLGDLQ